MNTSREKFGINWGGRPAVENPKNRVVAYRISDAEYDQLKIAAQKRGLKIGTFARAAALDLKMPDPVKPQIDIQTYTELGRIGNNLNQCTRHLHESGDQSGLDETIAELSAQVKLIQRKLMGL